MQGAGKRAATLSHSRLVIILPTPPFGTTAATGINPNDAKVLATGGYDISQRAEAATKIIPDLHKSAALRKRADCLFLCQTPLEPTFNVIPIFVNAHAVKRCVAENAAQRAIVTV